MIAGLEMVLLLLEHSYSYAFPDDAYLITRLGDERLNCDSGRRRIRQRNNEEVDLSTRLGGYGCGTERASLSDRARMKSDRYKRRFTILAANDGQPPPPPAKKTHKHGKKVCTSRYTRQLYFKQNHSNFPGKNEMEKKEEVSLSCIPFVSNPARSQIKLPMNSRPMTGVAGSSHAPRNPTTNRPVRGYRTNHTSPRHQKKPKLIRCILHG